MCVHSQTGLFSPLLTGDEVNFRLTYHGPLKAASQSDTRRLEKHQLRVCFDKQLQQLYTSKIGLMDHELANLREKYGDKVGMSVKESPIVKRGKFACLSLVREKLNLVCDLDILFMRREEPGALVGGGGDLDNRIKVLFDALRVPQDDNEVRGIDIGNEDYRLLVCLTEDDKLITGFRVTTDRLLEPENNPSEKNNVHLIINVEVKATKLTTENLAYFSHF